MISVERVSKSFGVVHALNDVTFQIERGAIVGLLGPNGAGKTTMMRLLTSFLAPSSGQILINGISREAAPRRQRGRVGYLPEHNPLYGEMTVRSFLSFVASLKGIPITKKKRSIEQVADQCDIGSVMKRMIGKLSKGYQQRIGLAQALLGNPEILILDEPTAGLDPGQIIEIRRLIRSLAKTHTILLSSHILPEVRMTCERVLILNRGKLVAEGTCEDLEHRLKKTNEFVITLSGDWSLGEQFLRFVPGVLDLKLQVEEGKVRHYLVTAERESEIRNRVAKTILNAGFELLALKPSEWNLEDIFLKIITSEGEEIEKELSCFAH